MRIIIGHIFVLITFVSFGQYPLPVVNNGNWVLIGETEKIDLSDDVRFVDVFDQYGFASFKDKNGYGIIDKTGEIVFKSDSKLEAYNYGYFKNNLTGVLININNDSLISENVRSLTKIGNSWILFTNSDGTYLYNLKGNKKIPYNHQRTNFSISNQLYYRNAYFEVAGYMFVTTNNFNYLFDDRGDLIDSITNAEFDFEQRKRIGYSYYPDVIIWSDNDNHIVITRNGRLKLPNDVKCVRNIFYGEIEIVCKSNSFIYNIDKNSIIFNLVCDGIRHYDNKYFKFLIGEKIGLVSKSGEIVFPAQYTNISDDENYFYLRKGSLLGLFDKNFKQLLPHKYTYFRIYNDFIYTENSNFYGLVSTKSFKELLPPTYDKINVKNNKIRAWLNDKMMLIELDDDHKKISEMVFTNAITVGSRNNRAANSNLRYDPRLFSLGWFLDSNEVKTNNEIKMNYKWGLKTPDDSIIVAARFNTPEYIIYAPISLIPIPKVDKQDPQFYRMIDYTNGKLVQKYEILSVDTTDFKTRDFTRLSHKNGWGIMNRDGEIKEVNYIDPSEETYLRFCINGKDSLIQKEEKFSVKILTRDCNSDFFYSPITVLGKTYAHQKFNKGEWNYLTPSGEVLFKESFEFAEPFMKGTAIVKTAKGYGVVNDTGFVIPPIYTEITRLSNFGDTVFQIRISASQIVMKDFNFSNLNLEFKSIDKTEGELYIFNSFKGKVLYNSSLKLLHENAEYVYLHKFNRYHIKQKKEYLIFDVNGNEIGSLPIRPKEFLDENNILVKLKQKLGVLSIDGDTLIPVEYTDIMRCGEFYIAQKGRENRLYDTEFNPYLISKKHQFLIDSISNLVLEYNGGKYKIKDLSGTVLKSGKLPSSPSHFHNGHIYVNEKYSRIFDLDNKEILVDNKWSNPSFLPFGFVILTDTLKEQCLFNKNFEEIAENVNKKRSIRMISENVVAYKHNDLWELYHVSTQKKRPNLRLSSDSFKDGYLLVENGLSRNEYFFINEELDDKFEENFDFAKDFKTGFAAVKLDKGWTIIDIKGKHHSAPLYHEVTVLSKSYIFVKENSKHGLFYSNGKPLLEVIYDNIEYLDNQLIRLTHEGHIEYFSGAKMKWLYSSKN